MKRTFVTTAFICLSFAVFGQKFKNIKLKNPDFEGIPQPENLPPEWSDCGFTGETPPDTHPIGSFMVTEKPYEGKSYIGMVTRDNGTYEAIGQKLNSPIRKDTCYKFSIYLNRSEMYISQSRKTGRVCNYLSLVKLRIYGGLEPCELGELLGETKAVKSFRWKEYKFVFKPQKSWSHIVFQAFYDSSEPENGNILLDNASDLMLCECPTKDK